MKSLLLPLVCARYNILSLDSASYKGIMTAKFVDYIETKAADIAYTNSSVCYPDESADRVAISEMFDLIAGSETGAIIATSLSIGDSSGKPLHTADSAVQFFRRY